MRSTSLTGLHQRAIIVLGLIAKEKGRIACYPDWIRSARLGFGDMRQVAKLEHQKMIAEAVLYRLTLHYARLVERINSVLTKSLQGA